MGTHETGFPHLLQRVTWRWDKYTQDSRSNTGRIRGSVSLTVRNFKDSVIHCIARPHCICKTASRCIQLSKCPRHVGSIALGLPAAAPVQTPGSGLPTSLWNPPGATEGRCHTHADAFLFTPTQDLTAAKHPGTKWGEKGTGQAPGRPSSATET